MRTDENVQYMSRCSGQREAMRVVSVGRDESRCRIMELLGQGYEASAGHGRTWSIAVPESRSASVRGHRDVASVYRWILLYDRAACVGTRHLRRMSLSCGIGCALTRRWG